MPRWPMRLQQELNRVSPCQAEGCTKLSEKGRMSKYCTLHGGKAKMFANPSLTRVKRSEAVPVERELLSAIRSLPPSAKATLKSYAKELIETLTLYLSPLSKGQNGASPTIEKAAAGLCRVLSNVTPFNILLRAAATMAVLERDSHGAKSQEDIRMLVLHSILKMKQGVHVRSSTWNNAENRVEKVDYRYSLRHRRQMIQWFSEMVEVYASHLSNLMAQHSACREAEKALAIELLDGMAAQFRQRRDVVRFLLSELRGLPLDIKKRYTERFIQKFAIERLGEKPYVRGQQSTLKKDCITTLIPLPDP